MSLDSDPEIDAAFSGAAAAASPAQISDDPEIYAAFAPVASTRAEKPKRVRAATEAILGPLELAGTSIANIPHAAAHGALDLYRRFTGGDTEAPDPALIQSIKVSPGPAGTQLASDAAKLIPARSGGDQPDDTNIPEFGETTRNIIGHTLGVAGDVGALAAPFGVAKALSPAQMTAADA